MTAIPEEYTEIIKQSQQAMLSAVEAWAKNVQDAFGKLPAVPQPVDPEQVIDQVFDFAQKLLAAQREVAKNLVHTSTQAAETIRQTATRTTEAPPEG